MIAATCTDLVVLKDVIMAVGLLVAVVILLPVSLAVLVDEFEEYRRRRREVDR